ncbi:MAG TPA: RNA polymerase sigma factor [Terriglobales bacterium]|nr:RNA polymerase sigma factor [Terriglobales bacterium]
MIDESSFRTFYESTAKKLWSYIFRVVGNSDLADDFLQESYFRFLRAEKEEELEPRMKAYLYRIATNLIRDYWRRKKRERSWQMEETRLQEIGPEDKSDRSEIVNEVFRKLTPQYRSLLWLAYVEEYDHREIASILDLRERSVRVLLYRARKKMMELIQSGPTGARERL